MTEYIAVRTMLEASAVDVQLSVAGTHAPGCRDTRERWALWARCRTVIAVAVAHSKNAIMYR